MRARRLEIPKGVPSATRGPRSPGARHPALSRLGRGGWLAPAALVAGLVPLALLGFDAWADRLGANPIEAVLDRLGWWTLVLLLSSLACTPARILLRAGWPLRMRRTLGLLAFGYGCLHFLFYVGVDRLFDARILWEDVTRRKFMIVGFVALLLLAPLAATSTKAAIRTLGGRRWRRLHRLAYVAAVLGVVHFVWRVKADVREPLVFAGVLAALFAIRLLPLLRSSGS